MRTFIAGLSRSEKALFAGAFIFGLGVEAAYFVGITGYAAYGLGAGPSLIATIMGALVVCQMIGSAVAGSMIDKIGPRKTIVISAVALATISILAQFIGHHIGWFIVFSGCAGFCFSLSRTGFNSFAPFIVKGKESLKRINSLTMISTYTASIIGPLFGGVIVSRFATLRVFIFCAIASLCAVGIMYFAREKYHPNRDSEEKHPVADLTEGMRLIFGVESIRYYALTGVVMWFSFGAFDALESLYYKDVVKVSVAWMGWVNTVIGIGLVLGVVMLTKLPKQFINAKFLTFLIIAEGVTCTLYIGTKSVVFMMIGAFLLGVAFGLAEPLMRTLVQADTPLETVGRVQGGIQVLRIAFTLLPLAVAPALSKMFGIQPVLVFATLLTAGIGFLMMPEAGRIDTLFGDKRDIDHIDAFEQGDEANPRDHSTGS